MFTKAEEALISEVDFKYPQKNLREAFYFYASLAPAARLERAQKDVAILQRVGFVIRGVPPELCQTIAEHHESLTHLVKIVAQRFQLPYAHAAKEIALNHDMPEAIMTDFIPADKLPKAQKSVLETLAAKIIFEAFPERLARWQEYEDNQTPASKLVHDLDKCEILLRTLYIEEQAPHLHDRFTGLWKDIETLLHTPEAKEIFKELKQTRDNWGNEPAGWLYTDMRKHYAAQKAAKSKARPGVISSAPKL